MRRHASSTRSWKTARPVTPDWISHHLAMSAEQIRLDRIYQEIEATGGDIRTLCDLFGTSIANVARWAAAVGLDLRRTNS
jgi:hypothetical protein